MQTAADVALRLTIVKMFFKFCICQVLVSGIDETMGLSEVRMSMDVKNATFLMMPCNS